MGTGEDHTARQIFWYRKRAISSQWSNANSQNLQEIPRTHSRTKWSQFFSKMGGGGWGETPWKIKMYVEKTKSDQNIWICLLWFFLNLRVFTLGLDIFFNIAKNWQPLSQKIWCSICAITLLQINSTEQDLQGVRWREFRRTWQNKILKIVNGGQGETTRQDKFVGTVNALYLPNGPTQIHQIYRKFLENTPAQNGGMIVSKF